MTKSYAQIRIDNVLWVIKELRRNYVVVRDETFTALEYTHPTTSGCSTPSLITTVRLPHSITLFQSSVNDLNLSALPVAGALLCCGHRDRHGPQSL